VLGRLCALAPIITLISFFGLESPQTPMLFLLISLSLFIIKQPASIGKIWLEFGDKEERFRKGK